jgi:FG-GAP-like repeat
MKWFLVFPLVCLSLSIASWAQLIDPILEWEWGYGTINPQYVTANLDSEATKELVFGNAQGRFYILGRQDTNYVLRYKSRWFGGTPVPVGAFDFDGNTRSDLVVVAGGRLRLFENQPGRYAEKFSLDLGGLGYRGGAVGDVDRDGQTEVCLGLSDGKIHLYVWQGNALVEEWQGAVPALGRMSLGDTDGDTTQEVVVSGGTCYVYGWNGSGFAQEWSCSGVWSYVDVGDMDGDGKAELAIPDYAAYTMRVWRWDGTAYVSIWTSGTLYVDYLYDVHCGDTDGDGRSEICAELCWMNNPHHCLDEVDVWGWNGSTFVGEGWVGVNFSANGFGTGDMDGDGRDEVILSHPFGDLRFCDATNNHTKWSGGGPGRSIGLGVGDTDGDGVREFITYNFNTYGYVLGWDGSRYRQEALISGPWSTGNAITVGELDGRAKREIVTSYGGDDVPLARVAVWGDSAGAYQVRKECWPGLLWPTVGDVDRDGQDELVGISRGNLSIWSWQDTGMTKEWEGSREAYAMTVGDVDGDTTVEIVIVYDSLWVLGWNGSTYVVEGHGPKGAYDFTGVAVGDVDGNGRREVVATTGGQGQILIYEWNGTTYALKWTSPDLGGAAFGPTTGDVIGTSTQEFFLCRPHPVGYRYKSSAWEQFWSGDTLAIASQSWSWLTSFNGLAVADLDMDGTNELACASDGYVHVLSFQYSGVEDDFSGRIQPLTPNLSFSVVPNPFVSFATVPGREKERFGLYDVSGRLVGTYRGDKIGWDAAPGVYFLKPLKNGSASMRIVKVK